MDRRSSALFVCLIAACVFAPGLCSGDADAPQAVTGATKAPSSNAAAAAAAAAEFPSTSSFSQPPAIGVRLVFHGYFAGKLERENVKLRADDCDQTRADFVSGLVHLQCDRI